MCYFNYLEGRQFLGNNKEYLYGKLLKMVQKVYMLNDHSQMIIDEPILIVLEILRVFYPAGNVI